MMPPFIQEFVGVPFMEKGRSRAGVDCWGLVRLFYEERLGIALPSYTENYATTRDHEEIGALVRREVLTDWREIPLVETYTGDVLVLRVTGEPMHIGIVIAPPMFLHSIRGAASCLERWDGVLWQHRIVGAYRNAQLANAQEPVLAQVPT